MTRRLLVLALALIIAGCASATTQTGLAASGQVLIGAGSQFVAISKVYQANCKPVVKVASLTKFCTAYDGFAPKFQEEYPLAVQAWKAAVSANDASKAQSAQAVIVQLSTDLAVIAGEVITQLGAQ